MMTSRQQVPEWWVHRIERDGFTLVGGAWTGAREPTASVRHSLIVIGA